MPLNTKSRGVRGQPMRAAWVTPTMAQATAQELGASVHDRDIPADPALHPSVAKWIQHQERAVMAKGAEEALAVGGAGIRFGVEVDSDILPPRRPSAAWESDMSLDAKAMRGRAATWKTKRGRSPIKAAAAAPASPRPWDAIVNDEAAKIMRGAARGVRDGTGSGTGTATKHTLLWMTVLVLLLLLPVGFVMMNKSKH